MNNPYLKLVSAGAEIVIPATDGQRMIVRDGHTVFSVVNSNPCWMLNVPAVAKPATAVEVYEMVESGTHADFFENFGVEVGEGMRCIYGGRAALDRCCLEQDQIMDFVRDNSLWLSREATTSFLFKVGDEYFVADVRPQGPTLRIDRFSSRLTSFVGRQPRLVIPKSASQQPQA